MRALERSAAIDATGPMPRPRELAARWGWPAAVIALGLGTFLLWLPYLDAPLDIDVGAYATVAHWWARGDGLYVELGTDRPQGIFVLFRAIEALGLGSLRGIHLFAALYASGCALALLAVARQLWGRAIGLGAAALFSLIMATPYLQGPTANAELFLLLPLLLSLLLLLRADDRPLGGGGGNLLLAGSGFAGALALLLKPPAFAIVALAALWLARRRRAEGAPWSAWLRAEAALALGSLAGLAPAAIHGLATAPDRYLYAIFFYRFDTMSVASSSLEAQLATIAPVVAYILARYPLLLLAPLGLAALRHNARQRDLLWLWLLTSFGGASIGGTWSPHYFQQLLPPLAVAAALALRAVVGSHFAPRLRPLLRVSAALGAIYLLALVGNIVVATGDPTRLVIDNSRPPGAIDNVAAYLRAHTTPQDRIYVAYGQADLYFLAGRQPAARWLHSHELGHIPGAWDEQIGLLTAPETAPRYIVRARAWDFAGLDADGRLRALVARGYALEATISGIALYRRLD